MINSAKTRAKVLGKKIKKIRELRGMTQQELGMKCGFSEATAHVRISQYENGILYPRENIFNSIINALHITQFPLFDLDLTYDLLIPQILFALEKRCGAHPVKIDNRYYIEFSPHLFPREIPNPYTSEKFLEEWYNVKSKLNDHSRYEFSASKELVLIERTYNLWKYEYPNGKLPKKYTMSDTEYALYKKKKTVDRLEYEIKSKQEHLDKLKKEIEKKNK